MGIVNVTPDSFSDGGNFFAPDKAYEQAESIIHQGASIVDIGGESSRPGSSPVPCEEQCRRVLPVIHAIHKNHPYFPISIDTTSSEVAEAALQAGACIINDISGLTLDQRMPQIASQTKAGVVIMHMQGTPKYMQKNPEYTNCAEDITEWLRHRINLLQQEGIAKNRIVVDPGIGFGKKTVHNLEILCQLAHFTSLGVPIMIGASRKRFIGEIAKVEMPSERLAGSLAALTCAVLHGADILRVHDVKESVQAARIAAAIKHPEQWRT